MSAAEELKKLRDIVGKRCGDSFVIHHNGAMAMMALKWCRAANAGIRFESDGTVSVWANGRRRRKPSLLEAVKALQEAKP